MRAQSSEQFDPSSSWRIAQGFLQLHGRSPDGEALSAKLIQVLMIGVWTGCRFALVDHDLALAIAALGNAQTSLVFEALGRGFASEFGEPMREVVHDVLYERGFTHTSVEVVEDAPDAPTAVGAIEEAENVLRHCRDRDCNEDEESTR